MGKKNFKKLFKHSRYQIITKNIENKKNNLFIYKKYKKRY